MRSSHLAVVVVLVGLVGSATAGPVFTLDDNPGVIGRGAEDPFGLGIRGAPLAPSPSLAVVGPLGPYTDGDVLEAGPVPPGTPLLHVVPPDGLFVDALSTNTPDYDDIRLYFSVDRSSTGLPLTGVANQTALNQQPGDIFVSTRTFASPANFVGLPANMGYVGALATAGVGGGNARVLDESALTLTPGGPPGALLPSNVLAPPIQIATHDNVDGFDWQPLDTDGDLITNRWFYFSVNPDEVAILAQQGIFITASDLFDVAPNTPQGISVAPFALAMTLGLGSQDDVDALVLYDRNILGGPGHGGNPTGAEPGIDYALFSLSPGSASLAQWNLNSSDIFFTDFSGSFALYAMGSDVGLDDTGAVNPFLDNVDALEISSEIVIPEPGTVALLALGALALARRRRRGA